MCAGVCLWVPACAPHLEIRTVDRDALSKPSVLGGPSLDGKIREKLGHILVNFC